MIIIMRIARTDEKNLAQTVENIALVESKRTGFSLINPIRFLESTNSSFFSNVHFKPSLHLR